MSFEKPWSDFHSKAPKITCIKSFKFLLYSLQIISDIEKVIPDEELRKKLINLFTNAEITEGQQLQNIKINGEKHKSKYDLSKEYELFHN